MNQGEIPTRKPGEAATTVPRTPAPPRLDQDIYQEYKRLERERELRAAVMNTRELSPEDSAYVTKLRTKSARGELVCSFVEKAEILAFCEQSGLTVSAYLLQLHRHFAEAWKAGSLPEELQAFTRRVEAHFGKLTGERTLADLETELRL